MSIIVAAFSGSLRRESYTTKLLKTFQHLAPNDITLNIIDISTLPFINQDLEDNLPQSVNDLHNSIHIADAILLATPEYNRSYTPVLKNALDWGSRPEGKNAWAKKPVAVVGCTPYSMGAFGAQHHLRQILVYLDMPTLQQPEFYLTNVAEKFNEKGELIDDETTKKINQLWDQFVKWINKTKN